MGGVKRNTSTLEKNLYNIATNVSGKILFPLLTYLFYFPGISILPLKKNFRSCFSKKSCLENKF
jgi:hypothetical protein